MSKHRATVNEGFLIKHSLLLTGLNDNNGRAIRSEIDALVGVDDVSLDKDRYRVKIAYDASRHNIDEMIGVIRKHGADISTGWLNRMMLNWSRQTDRNIRDNAASKASCCNKAPG